MNKLLLVCLLVFAPVSIASADLKVAVIDLGKAFEQYYKTKEENTALQEKKAGYQKEIQGYKDNFDRMIQEADALKKASDDPTLSAQARQDKATALNEKNQDLLNLKNEIEERSTERSHELEEELLQEHKAIVDDISKVINSYAGPQGYDLVVDKSSISAGSGVPIFLYNSSKLVDITADIVTLLNKTAPAGGGTGSSGSAPSGAVPAGP
ncbi:MAG TPA: OmpH family outer membrane protein [Candidatus Methylacidiphilales bacterium]|jgi:Skp family chaperone for outer membrane proteins|nr:OmpH family outer membrane protein [Candidatus Methylacidiphilales bacterium]